MLGLPVMIIGRRYTGDEGWRRFTSGCRQAEISAMRAAMTLAMSMRMALRGDFDEAASLHILLPDADAHDSRGDGRLSARVMG